MKRKYILVLYLIFSFLQTYCINEADALFKVTRIRSKGNYYLIYAKRNDSLFKVISKKVSFSNPKLALVKRGGCYYFDFHFNKKIYENKIETENVNYFDKQKTDHYFKMKKISEKNVEPLKGRVNKKNNYFIDGNTKIRLTKRTHYGIYKTRNLKGLYYIPDPPPLE